jgi:hypothetical protein
MFGPPLTTDPASLERALGTREWFARLLVTRRRIEGRLWSHRGLNPDGRLDCRIDIEMPSAWHWHEVRQAIEVAAILFLEVGSFDFITATTLQPIIARLRGGWMPGWLCTHVRQHGGLP